MNLKNLLSIVIVIVVMFVGLGVYHKMVVDDILIQSIKQETTKVINTTNNDVKTQIDNKFKKIDNLTSKIEAVLPITNTSKNEVFKYDCIPEGYSLVNDKRLSRRLLREKKKTKTNVFH